MIEKPKISDRVRVSPRFKVNQNFDESGKIRSVAGFFSPFCCFWYARCPMGLT